MAIKVGNKTVTAVLRGGVDVSRVLSGDVDVGEPPVAVGSALKLADNISFLVLTSGDRLLLANQG